MKTKTEIINEKLNDFFKDNCNYCTNNNWVETDDGEGTLDCTVDECDFKIVSVAQKLIDDVNEILDDKKPASCGLPNRYEKCAGCVHNPDSNIVSRYNGFLPSFDMNGNCFNYENKGE